MKNCGQFRELIEAYALGALDPQDRSALDAHLATGCVDCAKAVEEARWLVSQLAYTAPEAAPSDMLKGRLMQTVRAEAQAKPHVMPPRIVIPIWLWAGVAALLAFSIYSAWNTRRLQYEIRQANDRAATLLQEHQKTEQELAHGQARSHDLMDPSSRKDCSCGNSHAQGPQLEAKWHPQLGICVMGENSSHAISPSRSCKCGSFPRRREQSPCLR